MKGRSPTAAEWHALGVQTFGLTEDLFVPIAAADLTAIETYVGPVLEHLPGRKRPVNAVVVGPKRPARNRLVPLWGMPEAIWYYDRLHPSRQLWVHVDYERYRRAWLRLGFRDLAEGEMLDHVQNRVAVRLRGYRHCFLRLCPVSRETNTSGGLDVGAEGMEKAEIRRTCLHPEDVDSRAVAANAAPIILADPIDLTKMLNLPPGLGELPGVAEMLMKYYVE